MKNNFITKIIGATLAFTMMIGGAVGINANKQAKKLYADPGDSVTGTWTPITSPSEVNTSDDFLLAYEGTAGTYYGTGTITSKALVVDSSLSNAKAVTFESATGGYYIKLSDTNYLNNASGKTDMSSGANASAVWTINSNDLCVENTSNSNRFLGGASDGGNIKAYASGNKGSYPNVHVYKRATAKTPASIALSGTYPTSFYQGDAFSHEGMTVTVTYANGAGTANVTESATFSGYNMSNTGNQTVTVSYTENNVTVTTTYNIQVLAPRVMTGIELHGTITKTEYFVGDSWELDGLDIQVNWSSGDPTYVDLEDNSVVYECSPATATSTSVDSFDIEIMYSTYDETFTVDGLTVTEHPLEDVFNSATVPSEAIGTSSSAWGAWTEVTDYTYSLNSTTGAKYQVKLMGPGSNSYLGRMNNSTNGGFYTSQAPIALRIKTIAFSSMAASKNVSVYLQNEAYDALPDSNDYVTTLTSENLSYTVEGNYSCFAIRGRTSSLDIGNLTVTYEDMPPVVSASPSSFELVSGASRNVEISVENFASTPALSCSVTSGAASIANATVGALNAQNKATLSVETTDVPGEATIRVTATLNTDSYYVDVTVTVVGSPKSVVEAINSQASLSYKYDLHATVDTLTNESIGVSGTTYSDWADKTGSSGAVYAGQTAGGSNENPSIQLRSKNSNSGIITTTSAGNAKRVTVEWNSASGNSAVLDVYGKATAYSAPTDLYGDTKGTKLGSIAKGSSTSLVISGEYAYIGLRSNDGAVYLDSIEIQWNDATYTYSNVGIRFGGLIDKDLWSDLDAASTIEGYGVMISTSNSIQNRYNTVKESEGSIDGTFETVQGQAYKLVKGTDIRAFYNQVSTSPAESGNNYFWNLFQRVNNTSEALNRAYTAVAFIRTADDGIVFLGEVTKSAVQLAGEIIAANPAENSASNGSLAYLAGLAN